MELELLYEPPGLPAFDLPPELAAAYPGTLGFEETRVFANFVATVDGVVAIPAVAQSNRLIAAGSAADRFVMGLLRACADAVLLGSGTLAASPGGVWTPEQAFPGAAGGFAELRRRLGLAPVPEVVVLTASGRVDPSHPAFEAGALVLTTDGGRDALADRLPGAAALVSTGPGPELEPHAALAALRERGRRRLLHEGGPHAIGSFLAAGAVDELFLTVSPLLAGRGPDARLALVERADLLPGLPARLAGVRRESDHLFLRYVTAAR
ncbi:MAG TPA: dihydrofolate reductase family protein [Gaiellaceae bacterium]|nr:dihydrofolate reductase family protein [Gaiellaceae bacterium]